MRKIRKKRVLILKKAKFTLTKSIKKSKEEIAQALTGFGKESHLMELRQSYEIYQFFSAIEGVSANTIRTLISEIGCDVSAFASAKAFASWL